MLKKASTFARCLLSRGGGYFRGRLLSRGILSKGGGYFRGVGVTFDGGGVLSRGVTFEGGLISRGVTFETSQYLAFQRHFSKLYPYSTK